MIYVLDINDAKSGWYADSSDRLHFVCTGAATPSRNATTGQLVFDSSGRHQIESYEVTEDGETIRLPKVGPIVMKWIENAFTVGGKARGAWYAASTEADLPVHSHGADTDYGFIPGWSGSF